jgi:hypothetical protein
MKVRIAYQQPQELVVMAAIQKTFLGLVQPLIQWL